MKTNYEFANRLRLEIVYGAFVELDETWHRNQVCDAYTRLYFVQSGEGYLHFNGQEVKLEPGFMYLIPAGCRFDYGCTSLEKIYFHLMLTAVEGIDLLSAVPTICKLPISEEEFSNLVRWCDSVDYTDLVQMKTYLSQQIINCMQMCGMPMIPVRKHSALVVRAIDYIRDNIRLNLSVKEIAQVLFVSESKLRKDFRDETGMSLGKYIDHLVFLRAKQLLGDRTLSVGQISQRLGFCDQFYFSRRFKENFQQTPTQFRSELS